MRGDLYRRHQRQPVVMKVVLVPGTKLIESVGLVVVANPGGARVERVPDVHVYTRLVRREQVVREGQLVRRLVRARSVGGATVSTRDQQAESQATDRPHQLAKYRAHDLTSLQPSRVPVRRYASPELIEERGGDCQTATFM